MQFKNPPEEAWDLIRKLNEEPSAFKGLFFKKDPRIDLLNIIDKYPGPGLVQYISHLLFDKRFDVARKAADIIRTRLREISAEDLVELDSAMRQQHEYQSSTVRNFQVRDLVRIERFSEQAILWGVCTFFPNGYVRERATQKLGRIRTGEELRFLLLRLNDWAPQVRILAKTAVIERINSQYMGFFVDNIDFIERAHLWSRADHSDVLAAIEREMAKPENSAILLNAVQSVRRQVRRMATKIAVDNDAIPPERLLEIIKKDKDSMVRITFINRAKNTLNESQLLKIKDTLLSDGLMNFRREALRLIVDKCPGVRNEVLSNGLFDHHAAIRELSRWYLGKDGKSKDFFKQAYRKKIDSKSPHLGALLGIGEVGDPEDAANILPFLKSDMTKIRRSIVRSMLKLDPESFKERALEVLQHDSSSVGKEVRDFLIKNPSFFSMEILWQVFSSSEKMAVKRSCLSIAGRLSKWKDLLYQLKAADDSSEKIQALASHNLTKWINKSNLSFTEPSAADLSKIRDALATAKINTHLAQRIKVLLE